eukprot:g1139.t1
MVPYALPGELGAAKGMDMVADAAGGVDFVLALGDNFYSTGVADSCDPRFNATYDSVFSGAHLQVPWFVVAGNHDYLGNVSAQVAYSDDSARWHFPRPYYSFRRTGEYGTVVFIALDSVILVNSPPRPNASEAHWSWLEQELHAASAEADYLIVYGHFPVWSACIHGPNKILSTRLRQLLERYSVTLYLSGHDHCQQHMTGKADGKGSHVEYALTGTGDGCCYWGNNAPLLPKSLVTLDFMRALGNFSASAPNAGISNREVGGFASVSLTAHGLSIQYHNEKGIAEFEKHNIQSRTRALSVAAAVSTMQATASIVPQASSRCTGRSSALIAKDCTAWLDFFDAMQGASWDFGWSPVRDDPCSINVNPNQQVLCSKDGSRIVSIRLVAFDWFELPPSEDGSHRVETMLNGTIPASFGDLDALDELVISGGSIGPLPNEIGSLSSLSVLALLNVGIQGTIPPSIGQLTQLRQLSLFNNHLTGTIPASFQLLTGLETFQLPANTNLGGIVPPMAFETMPDWGCSLEQCNFTCPLPPGAEARCGARCDQTAGARVKEAMEMARGWPDSTGVLGAAQ